MFGRFVKVIYIARAGYLDMLMSWYCTVQYSTLRYVYISKLITEIQHFALWELCFPSLADSVMPLSWQFCRLTVRKNLFVKSFQYLKQSSGLSCKKDIKSLIVFLVE